MRVRLRAVPVFECLPALRRNVGFATLSASGYLPALRRNVGFTLIEVLVALVVVTAGLTIIAQGFLSGGRASVISQNRSLAAMLAESKMAEVEAGIISTTTTASGTFEPERPDFSWTVESESTTTTGLSKITLTITWKERQDDVTFVLTRLMRGR